MDRQSSNMLQFNHITDDTMAVMALTLRDERAPPVRLAQFARPLPLASDVNRIGIQVYPVRFHGRYIIANPGSARPPTPPMPNFW